MDWVDQGVWSEEVGEALRACARDAVYLQQTRHRAWAYIKPSTGSPEAEGGGG